MDKSVRTVKVDIILKPTLLRGWFIVKETAKCYLVWKKMNYIYDKGVHAYYVPKKNVQEIRKHKNKKKKNFKRSRF